MIYRFSFVYAFFLLLVSFSHNLDAQVYPDREELDVVRLVDGTVLKGVILEQVPDQYLEIELYGGSTFVLGYEQIEAVEWEANPDYGTTWIKVDLGAHEPESTATGDGDEITGAAGDDGGVSASDNDPRPLSAGGHLMGVYSQSWLFFAIGFDAGSVDGDVWKDTLSDLNVDDSDASMGRNGPSSPGLGLSYMWWNPITPQRSSPWMWGLRGSVGLHMLESGLEEFDEDRTEIKDGEVWIGSYNRIEIHSQGLFGIAGDRVALMGGLGVGVGLSGSNRLSYEGVTLSDGSEIDNDEEFSVNHPFMYNAAISGFFRLGRRWVVEAGIRFYGQFPGAYDEDVLFHGGGEYIAIGYRF